jgi:phosphoadenosine phosphosulfate reductase
MEITQETPISKIDIDALNKRYLPLTAEERINELYKDFNYDEVLLTSSFAANSAFFLHLFCTITESKQVVHFIDTTYHFQETLDYKKLLTEKYHLQVVDVKPEEWKNKFTQDDQTWKTDPDLCCSVNKVEPLSSITKNFKVWASGLMKNQNEHRKNLNIFELKGDILRFYPILEVTVEQRNDYIKKHELPFHPLVAEGYNSIGCKHCTVKGAEREGRWVGLAKTECGLHI